MAAPDSAADQLYSQIALHNKLVTEDQLLEAGALQKERYPHLSLGEVLVEKSWISASRHRQVLALADKLRQRSPAKPEPALAPLAPVAGPAAAPQPPAEKAQPLFWNEAVDFSTASATSAPTLPLRAYLKRGREVGASDLILGSGAPGLARVHGRLRPLLSPAPLTADQVQLLIAAALEPQQLEAFGNSHDIDLCFEPESLGRFRVNAMSQQNGPTLILRLIPEQVPTLQDLNLPPELARFTYYRQGMVLVTGPAGCGKTSTLAALIEMINIARADHIITLEDPVEFVYRSKKATINQRQIGTHSRTWSSALRSALRDDPDVIVVGEMRDRETVATAVTAAETGHLVFGTLHTINAIHTIDRLVDVFPPRQQPHIRAMLAGALIAIISQQLVPTVDGRSRLPAVEILINNPAVRNLIRDGRTFQLFSLMQVGRKDGMMQMDDSIRELLRAGQIASEEALYHAHDPRRFHQAES